MASFSIMVLGLLIVVILIAMLAGHLRGTVDLISTRNVYLLGLIVFQLSSGILLLVLGSRERYPLQDPVGTSVEFSLMAAVFLVLFLFAYKQGWGVKTLATKVPSSQRVMTDGAMWTMALAMTAIGAVLKLTVKVPLIGALSEFMGVGFSSIAAGMVGWIWAKRLLNPTVAAGALAVLAVNAVIALQGEFGRRPLAAVGGGFVWGMYWSAFRYLPMRSMLLRLAAIAAIPVSALALQTSIRSWDAGVDAKTVLTRMKSEGDLSEGLMLIFGGQDTAAASMWLMESFPEDFEVRPLHTFQYLVYYPIPRNLWDNKPEPLSKLIPDMAQLPGVKRGGGETGMTIGPGILGHVAAEGGWYALLLYPLFFGVLLRFFDELARVNPYNPLNVLPIGCALGQVLGFPRGETSVFTFIFLFSVVATWLAGQMLSRFVAKPIAAADVDHAHGEEGYEYDDGVAAEYSAGEDEYSRAG